MTPVCLILGALLSTCGTIESSGTPPVELEFSHQSGFYSEEFSLNIKTDSEGAKIHYTVNSSRPKLIALTKLPIKVTTSTIVRAQAFLKGKAVSPVVTQTFIFPKQHEKQVKPQNLPAIWASRYPGDYEVDPEVINTTQKGYSFVEALHSLPSVSLVTDPVHLFGPSGIYEQSSQQGSEWERPADIEFFYPDGRSKFKVQAGIRIHGNSSRNHFSSLKHSFRLLFKKKYGPRLLRAQVFEDPGSSKFNQLVLRACSTDSWTTKPGRTNHGVERYNSRRATYVRDQWMRDSHREMGHVAARGRYVHLFLNGLYWGVYNLAERLDSTFMAENLGGRPKDYDIIKDFVELEAGDYNAWNRMIELAHQGFKSDAAYYFIQGKDKSGRRSTQIPCLLDVENLMDYVLLHLYAGAEDWPHHNWWAARNRLPGSSGFKFFTWDQENSNDSLERVYSYARPSGKYRIDEVYPKPSPTFLFGKLLENTQFKQETIDRIQELMQDGGVLSEKKNRLRWKGLIKSIDRAIVGESARWGDARRLVPFKREVDWVKELQWVDKYWDLVVPMARHRFRSFGLIPKVNTPSFKIQPTTQKIELEVTQVKQMEYVGSKSTYRYKMPTDNSDGHKWKKTYYRNERTWNKGQGPIGFERKSGNESRIQTDLFKDQNPPRSSSVYLRIPFKITRSVELFKLKKWVLKMRFDDGFVAYLNGKRIASAHAPDENNLAWNSISILATEVNPFYPVEFFDENWDRHLSVGTNVLAIHGLNQEVGSSDFYFEPQLLGQLEIKDTEAKIYYTTDGSDPKSPQALQYKVPFTPPPGAILKYRAYKNKEWSALGEK